MRILNTIIYFLFLPVCCFAQDRNSQWAFGDSAGIDFTNLSNPSLFYTSIRSRGSCASISDSLGTLLFYCNTRAGILGKTGLIWNKNNQLMQNGDSIIGEAWYNEMTIINKPNANNNYYLLSTGEAGAIPGFFYSEIDMNLNGGQGRVLQKNIQLNNFKNADCVTAIKHGNGRDWWIFSKEYNSSTNFNWFYVYLVTPDSIYPPIIQQFNNASDAGLGMLVFNNDGSKLMQMHPGGFLCEYDFDRCTGIISNPIIIYPEQTGNYNRIFFSGAYSPDDTKFYASTTYYTNVDTSLLIQFDLTAANISASADTIGRVAWPVQGGQVRLAPDGKIYYTCFYDWGFPGYPYPDSVRNMYNENLGVINQPNNLGAACDYQPFSFYLGGKRTYYGLPNNPNYSLGPLTGSPCDTLGVATSEIEKQKVLDVFPNPFYNKIQLHFNTSKPKDGELRVLDLTGKQILKKKIQLSNQALDLSSLTGGSYLLEIKTSEFVDTKKLIKLD